MELLQLYYFQTVAKTGNMTKASEKLHIAQPSLSKTISVLEKQLGVKLFDRIGKRIYLNDYGKHFLVRVNCILNELENGVRELKDLSNHNEKNVFISSSVPKLLPNLIKDYMLENPNTKLHLLQTTQHTELIEQLKTSEVDIGISTLPIYSDEICCKPLMEENIYLITPQNHCFSTRNKITLKDIGDEPLIYYSAESGLSEVLNEFFDKIDFKPNLSCECTTPEITCKLVQAGIGVAFLPEYLINTQYTENLAVIPIYEPKIVRTVWIMWNKTRYLSNTSRLLRDFIFNYFEKRVNNQN